MPARNPASAAWSSSTPKPAWRSSPSWWTGPPDAGSTETASSSPRAPPPASPSATATATAPPPGTPLPPPTPRRTSRGEGPQAVTGNGYCSGYDPNSLPAARGAGARGPAAVGQHRRAPDRPDLSRPRRPRRAVQRVRHGARRRAAAVLPRRDAAVLHLDPAAPVPDRHHHRARAVARRG